MITKNHWIRPLAIASILAAAPLAWGQAPPVPSASASATTAGSMSAEATSHFEMGTRHYNLQEWAEAVKEYKEAYRLAPRPDILWSIAQSQRLGGDYEAAIKSYQAFVRTGPSEKQTALANEAIIKCQSALLEKKTTDATPPPAESAKPGPVATGTSGPAATGTLGAPAPSVSAVPEGPAPWYKDVLGDVLFVTGAAGVVFGGVALGIGNAKAGDANAAQDYASFERARGDVQPLQMAGTIGLAAGGALMAGGVLRFVLVARRSPAEPGAGSAEKTAGRPVRPSVSRGSERETTVGLSTGSSGVLVNVSGRF